MAPSVIPTGVIVREVVIRSEMVAGEACMVCEGVRVSAVMSESVGMSASAASPVAAVPTTVPAASGKTRRRGGQDQGNCHNASRQICEFHRDPPFVDW
jgi:hypothetical protein